MKNAMLRAVLFAGRALVAVGLGLTVPGCFVGGQCMAACESGINVEGDIDVKVADKPAMAIKVCYAGADCVEGNINFDASGAATCDTEPPCALTTNADGTAHLLVRMVIFKGTVEDGGKVDVHIERAADNTVLVDQQLTVANTTESEICGMTCQGASVSWKK